MGLAVFVVLGIVIVLCIFDTRPVPPDRSQAVMERHLVVNNIGQQRRSRPFRLLSRLCPQFSSSAGTDSRDVMNVLILQEYPFLPVCVHGPWIPPGDVVDVLVWKDQQGVVTDIRLNR